MCAGEGRKFILYEVGRLHRITNQKTKKGLGGLTISWNSQASAGVSTTTELGLMITVFTLLNDL